MENSEIKQILLVEDNLGDIRLIKEVFNYGKVPVNLNVVNNGVDAVSFLKRDTGFQDAPRPELVILDLNLPKKNGKEVLADIRSDKHLSNMPVIVLTSSEAESDVQICKSLKIEHYYTKPMELDKFVSVIEEIEDFLIENKNGDQPEPDNS
ncbi:MAG: response regulator [Ignavibacteria bacterium]|jgi:CheY-like chemotaxis protein|nr:response regulator [Ignavibacteria bacterium]MCU7503687.1 response regulator [Ignavibacteria bacterium]MCU7517666.1 response regulator [Ignavibacteria bacterium]